VTEVIAEVGWRTPVNETREKEREEVESKVEGRDMVE